MLAIVPSSHSCQGSPPMLSTVSRTMTVLIPSQPSQPCPRGLPNSENPTSTPVASACIHHPDRPAPRPQPLAYRRVRLAPTPPLPPKSHKTGLEPGTTYPPHSRPDAPPARLALGRSIFPLSPSVCRFAPVRSHMASRKASGANAPCTDAGRAGQQRHTAASETEPRDGFVF
jgi:hypothetical protein